MFSLVCISSVDTLLTAILEWTIAFGFVFYPLTFWIDLRRAQPRGRTMSMMEKQSQRTAVPEEELR